ncbi:hypothetical protein CgunFtcFv8_017861 [Champsocephalus gunnari]|uniref:Uncharacterized protein n=1 Tax=Champsocephalus gunnari TaxID=52237 RepID=A0AAN8DP55_CHAGU|nr:hypothetical protein CgunFtcFv8_017861 [Champsocephalus gunnari]
MMCASPEQSSAVQRCDVHNVERTQVNCRATVHRAGVQQKALGAMYSRVYKIHSGWLESVLIGDQYTPMQEHILDIGANFA